MQFDRVEFVAGQEFAQTSVGDVRVDQPQRQCGYALPGDQQFTQREASREGAGAAVPCGESRTCKFWPGDMPPPPAARS